MIDTSVPSLARACDHLLGGGASFAADRALGGRLIAIYPGLRDVLIASRTHVADSVARAARHGVDQFLDVGAGLPTSPATHQSARALLPGARVVYVDRDPEVVRHGGALVPPGVRYLAGDLAEPEAMLVGLDGLIDFSRPVCLVLGLVVQAVEPGTARAVVAVLVRALPPGSHLVLTAAAGQGGRLPDSVWPGEMTEADLASFFGGCDPLPPGVRRCGEILCATGVRAPSAAGGEWSR